MRILLSLLVTLVSLPLALPASAVDGVHEINQSCALAGCFSGDAPGFPVEITGFSTGSYRLTSNLILGFDDSGIVVSAPFVTIDLNGFTIRGLNDCSGTTGNITCTTPGFTFGVLSRGTGTTVRNGGVHGVGANGLDLHDHARVDSVQVTNASLAGIIVGADSLVTNNQVFEVKGSGITGQAGAGRILASGNHVSQAGVETMTTHVTEAGGNFCDDARCSAVPKRRYYMTEDLVRGNEVLTACDAGFHTASLAEIVNPSSFSYDTARGAVAADSGAGPPWNPGGSRHGWVRSGGFAANSPFAGPGAANCDLWTVGDSSLHGSTAQIKNNLTFDFGDGSTADEFPWVYGVHRCEEEHHVWCVQD